MVQASTLDLPVADGAAAAFRFVLGVYAYGNRTNGMLVRGSADSRVVNASRGGGVSWAFAGGCE
jgi:hypothetical protein